MTESRSLKFFCSLLQVNIRLSSREQSFQCYTELLNNWQTNKAKGKARFIARVGGFLQTPVLSSLLGRTHQLRVHCSSVGHAVVGDVTYSLGADNTPYRMMLHAYFLRIPLEREVIEVTASDPFVSKLDPNWTLKTRVRNLQSLMTEIVTKTKADERQTEEEKLASEEEKQRRRRKTVEESEEDRVQCQQWLSEWTLSD